MALYLPLANMRGIELDSFAASLARVTLWMGRRLAVEELSRRDDGPPVGDLRGA